MAVQTSGAEVTVRRSFREEAIRHSASEGTSRPAGGDDAPGVPQEVDGYRVRPLQCRHVPGRLRSRVQPQRTGGRRYQPRGFGAAPRPAGPPGDVADLPRSEEHTSELQSHSDLVCRLLLEKKKIEDAFHRPAKSKRPRHI